MTDSKHTLPPHSVSIHQIKSGIVIDFQGDLDLVSAPVLDRRFEEALGDLKSMSEDQTLFLDLRKLDFIDSAGLALLIHMSKELTAISRTFTVLVTEKGQPDRILRIGHFYKILDLAYEFKDVE